MYVSTYIHTCMPQPYVENIKKKETDLSVKRKEYRMMELYAEYSNNG